MRTRMLILAALALGVGPVRAAVDEHTTFLAHFDTGALPDYCVGDWSFGLAGEPVLVEGRSGKALQLSARRSINYPAAGKIDPRQGTIEFWLRWPTAPGQDPKLSIFHLGTAAGSYLRFNTVTGGKLGMAYNVGKGQEQNWHRVEIPPPDWQPGEWHHIAGTWSPDGVLSYIDGKPAAPLPSAGELPVSLGETFLIGDHPWHIERTTSSLIDDVRIYDRALSPEHIAAHFAGNYDFAAPLNEKTVTLRYSLDADTKRVSVALSTAADVPDERVSARVALVPKGGELPANAAVVHFRAGRASHDLQLKSLEPGEFDVVAAIFDGDTRAVELRRRVRPGCLE